MLLFRRRVYAVDRKLLLLWKQHAFVCGSGAIVWPSVCIVLASAVAWLLTKFGGHLRAEFTIPYSCVHLVSISGQCDASLRKVLQC